MSRWLILASLIAVGGCRANAPSHHEPVPVAAVESPHEVAVERLRRDVSRATLVAENNGRSAISYARAASAHMALARLAAEPEHWVEAERLLAEASSLAPDNPPRVLLAQLHSALHRPRQAMAELQAHARRVHPGETAASRAQTEALYAQLAHELGDYVAAQEHIDASLAIRPTATGLSTLARHRWLRADFAGARKAYEKAERAYGPLNLESRAWVKLQLGLMALERGQPSAAEDAYRAADGIYPGYWLVEEHLAEVLALQGRLEEARSLYESVVEQAPTPQLFGALASVCEMQGDRRCAQDALEDERAASERWHRLLPTMADSHGLRQGIARKDPGRVAQARQNLDARPSAEAWMLMAQAELSVGNAAAARVALEQAFDSPVRSAELYETAVAVHNSAGDAEKAEFSLRSAVALDASRRTRLP